MRKKTISFVGTLFVFIFIISDIILSQEKEFKFSKLTVSDGLPENSAGTIIQDYLGFIWFGTQNGLVKYDGYKLTTYRKEPGRRNTISNGIILSLHEDKNKNLWIGTWRGLNKFDRISETFKSYFPNPGDTSIKYNSLNSIYSIYEDKQGNFWMITGNKMLVRFDVSTNKFTHIKHIPGEINSISNDTIIKITNSIEILYRKRALPFFEDIDGSFWIGTVNGLNHYNYAENKFTRYFHDPTNSSSLSNNHITQLINNNGNGFWIATLGGGLNYYDKGTGIFTRYRHSKHINSIISDTVYSVYKDRKGLLWISTNIGVDYFDENRKEFLHVKDVLKNENSLGNTGVIPIFEEEDGSIWFLTYRKGIEIFNPKTKDFYYCRNSVGDPNSLSSHTVACVFEDASKTIWVGTYWGGVNKLWPKSRLAFRHYSHERDNPNSLVDNFVASICESPTERNVFWLGTLNGLDRFDRNKNHYTHFKNDPKNSNTLSSDMVHSVYEDKSGLVWIGTYAGGLNKYDPKSKKFTSYKFDPNNTQGITHKDVRIIYEDSRENLWIGTWGGGLNKFDRKKGVFKTFKNDPANKKSIDGNEILCIFEDKNNTLWISTNTGGLNKYDQNLNTFESFFDPASGLQIVSAIYEDSKGRFWLGTYQYGLLLFDRGNHSVVRYSENEGLLQNSVSGIMEGNDGFLWLITDRGISRFDPERKVFKNYDHTYGVDFKGFIHSNSFHKTKDGEMWIGSPNGFFSFYPKGIVDDPYPPKVALTGIKLFGSSLQVNEDSPLKQSISVTKEIVLSYWQNNIAIEFAALHFANPERNKYAYKLDNIDIDWQIQENSRVVNYAHLKQGEYVFRIKAANCDGVWNDEGVSLKIIINPPFWETAWFRIIITLFIFSLVFFGYRFRVNKLEEQKKFLEIQVAERTSKINQQKNDLEKINQQIEGTNANLKDMNILIGNQNEELKSLNVDLKDKNEKIANQNESLKTYMNEKNEFLGMVAHDLRNPLMTISGLSELIHRRIKNNKFELEGGSRDLNRISDASERMKKLIDDLLSISVIESSKIVLKLSREDIVSIVDETIGFFINIASEKSISLRFKRNPEVQRIFVNIDRHRIIQVMENLLTNAIKFTSPGGAITIDYQILNSRVVINVGDTGLGLEESDFNHLFKKFQTLSAKPTAGEASSGLGLAIVKKIVDLHDGEIWVKSEKEKGSIFSFSLKIDES